MILAWPLHHLHLLVAQEETLLNLCNPLNLQVSYMEMVTRLVLQVAGFHHYREFHLQSNQNGKSSLHLLSVVWILPLFCCSIAFGFSLTISLHHDLATDLARTILKLRLEAANCDDFMLSFCNVIEEIMVIEWQKPQHACSFTDCVSP